MPNYVYNRLLVDGDNAYELMEKYFTDGELDFNKVIAIPKELQIEDTTHPSMQPVYEENLKKYGFKTWYDFSIKKWGTKWNALEQVVESTTELTFQTAWNPPLPVIKELSKQNPTLTFTIEYAGECCENHIVAKIYKNGKVYKRVTYKVGSDEARTFIEETAI